LRFFDNHAVFLQLFDEIQVTPVAEEIMDAFGHGRADIFYVVYFRDVLLGGSDYFLQSSEMVRQIPRRLLPYMQDTEGGEEPSERNSFFIFYFGYYILGGLFSEALQGRYVFLGQSKNIRRVGNKPFILETAQNFRAELVNLERHHKMLQISFIFRRTFRIDAVV